MEVLKDCFQVRLRSMVFPDLPYHTLAAEESEALKGNVICPNSSYCTHLMAMRPLYQADKCRAPLRLLLKETVPVMLFTGTTVHVAKANLSLYSQHQLFAPTSALDSCLASHGYKHLLRLFSWLLPTHSHFKSHLFS